MCRRFPALPQDVSLMKSAPKLNPDGVSVADCKIIYAPAGQAGEYSKLATNPYRGSGHKCPSCYEPGILRMKREDFDARATPRTNFLRLLEKYAISSIPNSHHIARIKHWTPARFKATLEFTS